MDEYEKLGLSQRVFNGGFGQHNSTLGRQDSFAGLEAAGAGMTLYNNTPCKYLIQLYTHPFFPPSLEN